MPVASVARAVAETSSTSPYNRVVLAANAFDGLYVSWAKAMNSAPGMINAKAAEAMDLARPAWKDLERAWLAWMRGQ